MLKKNHCLLVIFLFAAAIHSKSQGISTDSLESKIQQIGEYLLYRNHDTTYIKNYAEYIGLKLVAVNKFNYFQVKDGDSKSKIIYRPEYGINLGVGMAYKWFSIDIAFDVGIREDKNIENYEFFDIQTRVYNSRRLIEAYLQYYNGYELTRTAGINNNEQSDYSLREDIRTISFGLQYLFAFNYDHFSLNAPFVLNEKQKKSAGSPIFGASMVLFTMNSDSSIVPSDLKDFFNERLHFKDVGIISFAANFGYMYTFVWKKHFFLTLGLIPGLNFNLGDTKVLERDFFRWNISYKVKTMNALGYNSRKFYGGIQIVGDVNNISLGDKYSTQFSNGSVKVFAGYRFKKREKPDRKKSGK